MILCDAHLHLVQLNKPPAFEKVTDYYAASCAHDENEFLQMEKEIKNLNEEKSSFHIIPAFGLHPQKPDLKLLPFLEKLCREKRISAIGESGFDFFTPDFKSEKDKQEEAWKNCLSLAKEYSLPLIIHDRKALDILFSYTKEMKSLPALLFHSFAFGLREAEALLAKGINAYFSFGKQLLNGNKKSLECASSLPLERLLLETDAPYQPLKGEKETLPQEIMRVYEKAVDLREAKRDVFENAMKENFSSLFSL